MRTKLTILSISIVMLFTANLGYADEGWIYPDPLSINDTVAADGYAWKKIWLINYDPANPVTIQNIYSSGSWINFPDVTGHIIDPLDSLYLPVTFNMTGFSGATMTGNITIYSSTPDSIEVNCIIQVRTSPPAGAYISVFPETLSFELEPDVDGEISLEVYNSGDLPLNISNVTNSALWLTPLTHSGTVTPLAPFEVEFSINTSGHENVYLSDYIYINSDAVNDPSLLVNIFLQVNEDSVGGGYSYGDVSYDGWCNEADVHHLVDYLMTSRTDTVEICYEAADVNGDFMVNIMDVVYLANYLRGSGGEPVNACSEITKFSRHLTQQQIKLKHVTGHRGEWAVIPVEIRDQEFYYPQVSFSFGGGESALFDNAYAENLIGHGYSPYASLFYSSGNRLVISDTLHPATSLVFDSLTRTYDLYVHVNSATEIGRHRLSPSDYSGGRGPTGLFQSDDYSYANPMFGGTYFTVAPDVTLDNISGVPGIAFLTGSRRSFDVSLDITSDADVDCRMHIFIQNVSTEDIVYSDTVWEYLFMGTHTYTFSISWSAGSPGNYQAGAEVLVDLDEPRDNIKAKSIVVTDQIYSGIPPTEDFGNGGGLIRLGGSPENPQLNNGWPPLFTEDERESSNPPIWAVYSLDSFDEYTGCAQMPGQYALGEHNDWLIYGPLTGMELARPTIGFYEKSYNWDAETESAHLFYVAYGTDWDIQAALANGPIETHTPYTHLMGGDWSYYEIELDDTLHSNDTVYFAWRYFGPQEKSPQNFDIWRVDYIFWFDNTADEYEYVPGDANMYNGEWPPRIVGGDGTYLINYFRGYTSSIRCLIEGFWMSADVNGDCQIINSDATRLINYLRGSGTLEHCPDYEPRWETPAEAAADSMPSGWPNCE
jgi:hypothetical protein